MVSAGPTIRLAAPADSAIPVDVGTDPGEIRTAAATLARELPAGRSRLDAADLAGPRLTAFVEGLVLGMYRFTRASAPPPRPELVELCGATDADALARGLHTAAATAWARDLANTRSGEKTPAWLAAQAARTLRPLGVEVVQRDENWLREQGFGGVLAVGGGSSAPPRLIEARWRPKPARQGVHVVLVGKGITFDTGGINRKTGSGMDLMYTDMAGGAAVLAAMQAIASVAVPVHVTALVPTAENAISGSSYRPGDVVRHYGGRTSEIGNTDAEGRLVLADAIAYAAARLRPTAIVDIATLTGAAKTALGLRTAGLFSTSDPLADGLARAAAETDEALWRLPLPADYESLLDSPIADATNAPGNPGAITAALFLRPFAKDVAWAHVDMAGPARATKDDGAISRGATGFGARLLHRWVESLA
ncbi:MAG: M17 family metallopeptidase [Jatrophihabitans sp.]|uniref:leucyl aminopeptidase family protein n=1 Tax=Jatrophihabitans sp. TaxID=1932789 RepID=UPI00390EF811